MPHLELAGQSAFLPVEAEDGRFSVLKVKYGDEVKRPPLGSLSFSKAERKARALNRKAGIPSHIWWAIAERLKNADV